MYKEQLQRISSKLHQLRQADTELAVFGADCHDYELDPVKTPEEIRQLESDWNVSLPEDYKAFLMEIGAGGAGPYYGLEKPEEGIYVDLDYKDLPNDISGEFPYTETWNPEVDWFEDDVDEDESAAKDEEYFSDRHSAGMLRISNFGCGVTMNLIVNGNSYGEIWVDDRGNSGGIYPDQYFGNKDRLNFLDWYELWLDQSLAKVTQQ
ncbi:SMI1/KNR4 family protein [Paenibacillus sp. FSL K6-1230]|uniref:SMI1/KNR4 family protein n=1 Tax=Paenibacillus sp. FSL K6-1230 TaxID=2921603 RepID=UPI0003A84593